MAQRVRRHPDFLADLAEQVRWLEGNRDATWIERLRDAVAEAMDAIARFPEMGVAAGSLGPPDTGAGTLRKLVLRHMPFVLWYHVGGDDIRVLRLFHARQKQPHPGRRRRPAK